jgi:Na+/phosphate symporter
MKPLKDLPFAIVFVCHVLCIFALAMLYGLQTLLKHSNHSSSYISVNPSSGSLTEPKDPYKYQIEKYLVGFILTTILSSSLSILWVYLTSTMATKIVEFSLTTVILFNVSGGIIFFISGNSLSGLVLLLVALASLLFFLYVRSRIEFISANLQIACQAIWSMSSLITWSLVILFIQVRENDETSLQNDVNGLSRRCGVLFGPWRSMVSQQMNQFGPSRKAHTLTTSDHVPPTATMM